MTQFIIQFIINNIILIEKKLHVTFRKND
jgi:hypothetical protein